MTRRRRAVLVTAAFAVLVAALGDGLRVLRCVGGCCVPADAVVAAAVPDDDEAAAPAGCCCCDDGGAPASRDRQPELEDDGHEDDLAAGRCQPDCCIETAFAIELLPAPGETDVPGELLPALLPASRVAAVATWPASDRLVRPFERGPPTVDRLTALRACTVLLI